MVIDEKLNTLTVTEFNLIANKDPNGSYDRRTRENLGCIINKLADNQETHSALERKLFYKFRNADFDALEKKAKKVRFEVARYRLSSNVKRSIKLVSSGFGVLILSGYIAYEFILDTDTRQRVDIAYYAGLNKIGLVSKEGLAQIRQNLQIATTKLQETSKENEELNQMVEQMIHNNEITENLKHILKQIYNDPKTKYFKTINRIFEW